MSTPTTARSSARWSAGRDLRAGARRRRRGRPRPRRAILAWPEEHYPDPPLYPSDSARAEIELFLDWFNRVWKRPPNELEEERGKASPDPARVEELGAEVTASLDVFEGLLAGRDYLLGDFSVADCAAFPFLRFARYEHENDEYLYHHVLIERLRPLDGHPRVAAWIERVEARPRG